MRILSAILLSAYSVSMVQAAVFNYSNDPFPQQNCPQMNNIYETEPAIIQQEKKKNKKAKKCWFRTTEDNKEIFENNGVNEGIIQSSPDGSFYLFK